MYVDEIKDIEEIYIKKAEKVVDVLTFQRIANIGFDNLTTFQKETIKQAVCDLALFFKNEGETAYSIFEQYSINGVTMKLGGKAIEKKMGYIIPSYIYADLTQTGLTCLKL